MSNGVTENSSNQLSWPKNGSAIGLPLGVGAVAFFVSLIIGAMVSENRIFLKSFFGPAGSVVIGLITLQITAIVRAKKAPAETVTDGKIIPPVLKVLLNELAGLASLMALVSGVFAWIISVYYNSSFGIDMHRDEAISAIQKNGLVSSVPLAIALSGYCLFITMTGKFFQEKPFAIHSPIRIPNLDGSQLNWSSKDFNTKDGGSAILNLSEPISQEALKQIKWEIKKLSNPVEVQKGNAERWDTDLTSTLEVENLMNNENVAKITIKVRFAKHGNYQLDCTLNEEALVNMKNYRSEKIFQFKTSTCSVRSGESTAPQNQNQPNNHSKPGEIINYDNLF